MDISLAQNAVFKKSEGVSEGTPVVCGYDFNKGINYEQIFLSYLTTGFQATHLAVSINVCLINNYKAN